MITILLSAGHDDHGIEINWKIWNNGAGWWIALDDSGGVEFERLSHLLESAAIPRDVKNRLLDEFTRAGLELAT